ncbi:30S ribosomal protein S16 [Candidatus Pantoea carbekii]|uniref:Small ribosomal subunit protein bS16 n=1 Tax=Candidatus Pantoea carbekii TaxID=1235990 RepID=U3U748_9GAMM|nr:30S ribosomal protein S16 [Candidatus Pantoea carbekii]AKC32432.1 30S ribosomal protein S16 [Candidatus Pantoea carbekii]BAO00157.1 30S ribosomal protein S16 [Candidatus Pantoea carbekii]
MVTIRLARHGSKKRPFYQIVVSDSSKSRDGRFIERVGFLNPILSKKSENMHLNFERVMYWINKGATLSRRVNTLVKKEQSRHINISNK